MVEETLLHNLRSVDHVPYLVVAKNGVFWGPANIFHYIYISSFITSQAKAANKNQTQYKNQLETHSPHRIKQQQ